MTDGIKWWAWPAIIVLAVLMAPLCWAGAALELVGRGLTRP